MVFPLDDFPELAVEDGWVVGKPAGHPWRILVVALAGGAHAALDARCTHQGCTVGYSAAQGDLACPCHQSRFALDGSPTAGPALSTGPLAAHAATSDGTAVIVTIAAWPGARLWGRRFSCRVACTVRTMPSGGRSGSASRRGRATGSRGGPMRGRRMLAGLLVLATAPGTAAAASVVRDARKSTRQTLSVEVQRLELGNGLVVLLSPDPTVSSVAVWMTFRAGAVHEPPGLSGLAHLVEHVMASGPTPDTDYASMLEGRRARAFNASTGFDRMDFQAIVPAEELPIAIWVAGDRLATLPGLVDPPLVERHRRVVAQERALRNVDAPYGLVREHLFRRLYARPHPLHGGVIGEPAELARATAEDVRRFASTFLVPANAILTVVGRFDPAVARTLVEESLGRLPAGRRAEAPPLPPFDAGLIDERREPIAREPRVTLAWRLGDVPREDALALQVGAQLLTYLTDGAWDMRISADLSEFGGESLFTMDLTVPYDEPMSIVHRDADAFLRFLTHREMPVEHLIAANLALDRHALFGLDSLEGRAQALAYVEFAFGPRETLTDWIDRRWELEGGTVRDTARIYLRRPGIVLHARPTRPKPARLERE